VKEGGVGKEKLSTNLLVRERYRGHKVGRTRQKRGGERRITLRQPSKMGSHHKLGHKGRERKEKFPLAGGTR